VQCTLTTAWTGGVGSFTVNAAKNRSTPQLLEATVPVGGAVGQVLINTTHASHALIYKNVAGNEWLLTQPVAVPAVPFNVTTIAEDDSWTTNDVVTGSTQSSVNLADLEPVVVDSNSMATNGVYVVDCAGNDPLGLAFGDSLLINNNVSFVDSTEVRNVFVQPVASINAFFNVFGWANAATLAVGSDSVIENTSTTNGLVNVLGGFLGGRIVGSFYLDDDTIVSSTSQNALTASSYPVQVYIETGAALVIRSGGASTAVNFGLGGPFIWGPGYITVAGILAYPAGAGAATSTFLQKGAWIISVGGTKACLAIPSAATSFGTCNITLSTADLDTNLGATTGCLSVSTGASVCN
jgi:hypothetical protein